MSEPYKLMTELEREQRRQALDELAAEAQRQGFCDDTHPYTTTSPIAGDKPRS